jgi:hypothetical protein
MQNINSLNQKATDKKEGSGNCLISNILYNIKVRRNLNSF